MTINKLIPINILIFFFIGCIGCSNKELNHLVDLIIRYYLFNEENTIENLDKIISIIYNERFDFVKHIHFVFMNIFVFSYGK